MTDSGCCIDRDFLPHMFDRFRQGDAIITRQYAGLGLGLAIVQHLVEAHGGTVTELSDGPGLGAEFTVSLPVVLRRRDTDATDEPSLTGRETEAAMNRVNVAKDAEYFEQLVLDAVTAEPADETGWRGVLRTDRYTSRAITTVGGKAAVDEEVEKMRRVLAMIVARTLQAYGVYS